MSYTEFLAAMLDDRTYKSRAYCKAAFQAPTGAGVLARRRGLASPGHSTIGIAAPTCHSKDWQRPFRRAMARRHGRVPTHQVATSADRRPWALLQQRQQRPWTSTAFCRTQNSKTLL